MTQTPSRRDLLKGRFTPRRQFHVASLMVQAWPDRMADIQPALNRIPGVEVHQSTPEGRLVITVETENDDGLMDIIRQVERTDGVVTASLVYHQFEDEDDA